MAGRIRVLLAAALIAAAGAAWGGHELAVYPSYYPHEIRIEAVPPDKAAELLAAGKIQAYIGAEPRFAGAVPPPVRTIESLGSIVTLRLNPVSPLAGNACAGAGQVIRELAADSGLVVHPYPVTPLHGDYLWHVDRAEAAKARLLGAGATATAHPKIRVAAALANLVRPEARAVGPEWDAALEAADIARLVAGATLEVDGWSGPVWLRAGWFHAERLLADAIDDPEVKARVAEMTAQLQRGELSGPVERINLERDLVSALTSGCHKIVVGYTVKQEYFTADFNDGIENVGFDAIGGLNSAMFIRTVKLKNFPWNGWLALGMPAAPAAAWNPIAGFGDEFGRLLWAAIGDPALLPDPYGSGWMLNRISDVR